MTELTDTRGDAAQRSIARWLIILGLGFLVAMIFAWRYANTVRDAMVERARTEAALVVDSRAAAVNQWLKAQASGLEGLAGNQALGLYLATALAGEDVSIIRGQAGYLRTLLEASADRTGFSSRRPDVRANLPVGEAPGLALVGVDGKLIAQAGGPIPPPGALARPKAVQMAGLAVLAGRPALRLSVPVSAPMGDETIGAVYGVRWLDETLAQTLVQPGDTQAGAQIYLVGKAPAALVYLLAPQGQRAGSVADLDPAKEIAGLARSDFAQADGLNGEQVFLTSRTIEGTGWIVVRAVPVRDITGPADQRRTLLLSALVGGLTALAALVLLAWRNNAVITARQALAQESDARAYFERLANVQPTGLAVISTGGIVSFANDTLRRWRQQPALAGEAPDAVFGGFGALVHDLLAQIRQSGGEATAETKAKLADNLAARHLQIQAVALPQQGETLIVAEDVTALVEAHERREQTLDALVRTLMGLIDVRDPGSANHSQRVSQLAQSVGRTLGWSPVDCDTLATCGLLMNVGKLFAPRALLTKTDALSEAERASVREAMARASHLLTAVPFEGPVSQTLDEVHGDQAARGRLARLLLLSNALVSMVSPRAHRPARQLDDALNELRQGADADDLALLNAIAHTLANIGGRAGLMLAGDAIVPSSPPR
jgi:hypothetical protein